MAKTQTHYVCQSCGRTSPRKLGKCPTCESWDSFVEEILTPPPDSKKKNREQYFLSIHTATH